jgi:hypothetical protein
MISAKACFPYVKWSCNPGIRVAQPMFFKSSDNATSTCKLQKYSFVDIILHGDLRHDDIGPRDSSHYHGMTSGPSFVVKLEDMACMIPLLLKQEQEQQHTLGKDLESSSVSFANQAPDSITISVCVMHCVEGRLCLAVSSTHDFHSSCLPWLFFVRSMYNTGIRSSWVPGHHVHHYAVAFSHRGS